MRYRIRREWILSAIYAAKESEKGQLVVSMEPLTGISVDMAQDLLRKCEIMRWQRNKLPVGMELRGLVERVVRASSFPPDRTRAYVLIMMRYYRTLKGFVDIRSKQLNEARAAKLEALRKLREEPVS